jgi:penicillin-binding protein-related factor A (putative recombinase)
MGTRWDVQSHEDKYSSGIPDLSFGIYNTNGWIELKQIKKWNGDKPVKPDHYTSIQVNWLNRREKSGGNCFVMIKIENDYYILAAKEAKKVKTGMNKDQYDSTALAHWHKSIDPGQLSRIISRL